MSSVGILPFFARASSVGATVAEVEPGHLCCQAVEHEPGDDIYQHELCPGLGAPAQTCRNSAASRLVLSPASQFSNFKTKFHCTTCSPYSNYVKLLGVCVDPVEAGAREE